MDPGTIITTVMASAKLAKYVGLFFESAATQKLEFTALSTELSSLSRVLAFISKNSKDLFNSVSPACSQSQSQLWDQFVATLQECEKILKVLDELMPAHPNTDNETQRLRSRVKYAWNKSEIGVWTARLKALKGTTVLNVSLALEQQSSEQSKMDELQLQMTELAESMIHITTLLKENPDIGASDGRKTDNLDAQDPAHDGLTLNTSMGRALSSAATVYSQASVILGGSSRDTMIGSTTGSEFSFKTPTPSLYGIPLNSTNRERINNWVHSVPADGDTASIRNSIYETVKIQDTLDQDTSSEGTTPVPAPPQLSSDDIYNALSKRFETEALQKLEENDFKTADEFFKLLLTRYGPLQDTARRRLRIARAYFEHKNLDEAYKLASEAENTRNAEPSTVVEAQNLMALIEYDRKRYSQAEVICRQAVEATEQIMGKESPSYRSSVELFVKILEATRSQESATWKRLLFSMDCDKVMELCNLGQREEAAEYGIKCLAANNCVFEAADPDYKKRYLEFKSNIKLTDKGLAGTGHGAAALHWLAQVGCWYAVEELLSRGADIHAVFYDDMANSRHLMTSLDLACGTGGPKVVSTLLSLGANPDPNFSNDERFRHNLPHSNLSIEWWPSIFYAIAAGSLENVKILVQHGADINSRNAGGNTPLHFAIALQHLHIVEYLVNNGARAVDTNRRGQTALECAEIGYHSLPPCSQMRSDYRRSIDLLRKNMELPPWQLEHPDNPLVVVMMMMMMMIMGCGVAFWGIWKWRSYLFEILVDFNKGTAWQCWFDEEFRLKLAQNFLPNIRRRPWLFISTILLSYWHPKWTYWYLHVFVNA